MIVPLTVFFTFQRFFVQGVLAGSSADEIAGGPGRHREALSLLALVYQPVNWVRPPFGVQPRIRMLVLTENATTVIEALVERPDLPEGAGLRIARGLDGSEDLEVSAATTPAPGDRVVEAEGARVFLEAQAAAALDGKVLDARVDDQGYVEFLVVAQ